MDRRRFLTQAAASALLGLHTPALLRAQAPSGLQFLAEKPFSYDGLVDRARALAAAPYRPPAAPRPDLLEQIDYDAHGKIRYDRELALRGREKGDYRVTLFHLGRFFKTPVQIHLVAGDRSRQLQYRSAYFTMPADAVARKLPNDAGFAGFRLHETSTRSDWGTQDWLAFLGASYFRAIGDQGQYGLSARGLALNTTAGAREEFPLFTEFYIEPGSQGGAKTLIHALLDSPSVAGAYRFECTRGTAVTMNVECALFLREDVPQLGVAPLTSMFWYAEYDKPFRADWRPEIHDSDGLLLRTGSGEQIFRPLNAPPRVVTSSFYDNNPRGFGLVQRDRCFDHYLDGVHYERRPTCWVTPLDDWGPGRVQLVELPTGDEYHDNIVAFWTPEQPARRGDALRFRYQLQWQAELGSEVDGGLARVSATRLGQLDAAADGSRPLRFLIEFAGAGIEQLPLSQLRAVVSASSGSVAGVRIDRVAPGSATRLQFDLAAQSGSTVELKAHLRGGSTRHSETWAHQLHLG